MCCGNGGGTPRTNTQTRSRLSTTTTAGRRRGGAVAAVTWKVTLPDGTEQTGLTEHQALMLTLKNGGGMEQENAPSATPI